MFKNAVQDSGSSLWLYVAVTVSALQRQLRNVDEEHAVLEDHRLSTPPFRQHSDNSSVISDVKESVTESL